MKSVERVLNSLNRKGHDRLPVRYLGEPHLNQALIRYLDLPEPPKQPEPYTYPETLVRALGDDFRYVQPAWAGPPPRTWADGSFELVWPARGWPVPVRYVNQSYGDGKGQYVEAHWSPFRTITDVDQLDRFEFPRSEWLDYSSIRAKCRQQLDYCIITGTPGVLGFLTGISLSRGLEQVLMDIAARDPVYMKLREKSFQFHYEMIEKTLLSAQGGVHIVLAGDDLGVQDGLLISPRSFDDLFAPKYREFFDMVHRYGAKTMLHCCGSAYRLIGRFIDLGLDILDVVQTSAADMDIRKLHAEFGRDLCFSGTMCVQSTLPHSTPDQIRAEVRLRRELFADGGLILGPSHLIQEDTPLENILALYDEAGSLAHPRAESCG
jgi:uroporphyrinogen decarboxylase